MSALPRPLPLVYVGNQYDRDEAFAGFFAPAAARHRHRVAGKWTRTAQWPHVASAGQMTQRIFEAVLAGCLPLTPAAFPFAGEFTPEVLHVDDGRQPPTASPSCAPSPAPQSTPPSSAAASGSSGYSGCRASSP